MAAGGLRELAAQATPGREGLPLALLENHVAVLDREMPARIAPSYRMVRDDWRRLRAADARLVALAPEMAALLADAMEQFQRLVDTYDGQGWETVHALLARFDALNQKAAQ